jgi:hypothetical protein
VSQNLVRRAPGFSLRGRRAGEAKLAWNHPAVTSAPVNMTLTSDWFEEGGVMPDRAPGLGIGANTSRPLTCLDRVEGCAMQLGCLSTRSGGLAHRALPRWTSAKGSLTGY